MGPAFSVALAVFALSGQAPRPVGGAIGGCGVTTPTGEYAVVVLDFELPANPKGEPANRWTHVGGMRDGRLLIDHGVGVRESGGVLELKDGKLTGSFTQVRRIDKKTAAVLRAAVDASVTDNAVNGTAKFGDQTVKVTGRVVPEAEMARRNAVPRDKGWPSFLGPVNGGGAAEPTGAKLIDSLAGLRPLWRTEEPLPQGLAPLSRFMHTWKDASDTRTGGGGFSPVLDSGRLFAAYFVPAPGKIDQAKLDALTAEAKAAGAVPLPEYAREKLFESADEVVVAFDAATGKTLWKAVVKGRGASNQHHKTGPFNLSPAAGGGRVFALGTSGNLYAFDAATGEPLWEAVSHKTTNFFGDNRASSYTPCVFPGVVVAPDQGRWAGYDAATGKRLWTDKRVARHCTVTRWDHGGKSYVLAGVGAREAAAPEELVCLDVLTGKQAWAIPLPLFSAGRGLGPGGITAYGDTLVGYAHPVAEGGAGTVKAADEDTKKARPVFCVAWKLDPAGIKEVWRVPVTLPTTEHVPVVVNKRFVFVGDLQVIDLASGKVTGKTDGLRPMNGGYLMAAEDVVLVRRDGTHGGIDVGAYRVDAAGVPTPLDGGAAWVPAVGGATTSYHHPIMYPIVDGRLYLRQYDGIYCYDLRAR